ncbi:MAG: lipid-A-disaccharide synthase N-terminal domain-containing protein [Candidatus Aenigmarchaeota archaeon]|nr:lipid-A-disaccharide synthase N-terminal domain-containing protein [Candidatus Aenigmarchaeota archaeon]
MIPLEVIGTIGLIAVAAAWIPETIRTLKTKKSGLELKFNLVYVAGSLVLVAYSVGINDMIFIALNTFASIMSLINLYYTIKEKRRR